MNTTALILIDYINEIVDPNGKLAAKGYSDYIERHGVYDAVQSQVHEAQAAGDLIVAVGLAFLEGYADQPKGSPILGKAAEFGILRSNTWSTSYTAAVVLPDSAVRLTKNRVSAFSGSILDGILRSQGVKSVRLAGVSTDLAVEATARAAHDLDYRIEILAASCAAANDNDHARSLTAMEKFATIV